MPYRGGGGGGGGGGWGGGGGGNKNRFLSDFLGEGIRLINCQHLVFSMSGKEPV